MEPSPTGDDSGDLDGAVDSADTLDGVSGSVLSGGSGTGSPDSSSDMGLDGDLDGEDDSTMGGSDMGSGGGFAGGFGGGMGGGSFGSSDSDSGDDTEASSGITPPGEPEKNAEDPVGAAVREAEKVAGQTTDAQKILNALKASIQVNFSDYQQAWPIVAQLKQTENKTLQAVASRLALFIADVLNEGKTTITKNPQKILQILWNKDYGDYSIRKVLRSPTGFYNRKNAEYDVSISPNRTSWYTGFSAGANPLAEAHKFAKMLVANKKAREERKTMKISKTELKEMIRSALKNQESLEEAAAPQSKKVRITKEQLQNLVREAVKAKLQENTSYVEHERMRQEVNMLALEFLEKLTAKLNIDPGTLSPEALETYKRTHKALESSVRTAAAELFQLGAVLKAAQGPESSGGSNS